MGVIGVGPVQGLKLDPQEYTPLHSTRSLRQLFAELLKVTYKEVKEVCSELIQNWEEEEGETRFCEEDSRDPPPPA